MAPNQVANEYVYLIALAPKAVGMEWGPIVGEQEGHLLILGPFID
jgi:hypothetical protein